MAVAGRRWLWRQHPRLPRPTAPPPSHDGPAAPIKDLIADSREADPKFVYYTQKRKKQSQGRGEDKALRIIPAQGWPETVPGAPRVAAPGC